MTSPFSVGVVPDCEAFLRCLRREGTPLRVHGVELFLDPEIQTAICDRYELLDRLTPGDPFFEERRQIALQSFLGYDYVRGGLYESGGRDTISLPIAFHTTDDVAPLGRKGGRGYPDLNRGPITNWKEFEAFPWPDPRAVSSRSLEWYEKNLPDNMCLLAGGSYTGFCMYLYGLMGFEGLAQALYEQRDLVVAISKRLVEFACVSLERELQFNCVKAVWGTDDMGFRTSTIISPKDLREFALPGHKLMAEKCHAAGRLYLLHCCGNVRLIMEDLIEDVKIDAKHSFEDVILEITQAKQQYGHRIALLGGLDMDFLCGSSVVDIRRRVRSTLEKCMTGGGYCLGTGNSVANYVPLDNYLAMLDEGRKFAA